MLHPEQESGERESGEQLKECQQPKECEQLRECLQLNKDKCEDMMKCLQRLTNSIEPEQLPSHEQHAKKDSLLTESEENILMELASGLETLQKEVREHQGVRESIEKELDEILESTKERVENSLYWTKSEE